MKLSTHYTHLRPLVTRSFLALTFASLLTAGCTSNKPNADSTSKKSTSNNQTSAAEQPEQSAKKITAEDILIGENDQTVVDALQKNLEKSGINTQILSAEPLQIDGLYWVTAENVPSFFTDKAGKHVIQGQVVAVGDSKPVDIGAKLDARGNKDKLAQVAKKDMIIYPAQGETKNIIYIFTDSTCPYCKKQHEEIDGLNQKGIEVRYLAWPRNPRAEALMEAVWCSEDRKSAMDAVQANTAPESKTDENCKSIVESQTKLGHTMGVRGTPAIYTKEGEQLSGYSSASAIAKMLGIE